MSEYTAKITRWRKDPRTFVREVFRATPDAWQDEVLEAFYRNQRIAMKACKGPGKSTILAWLIWNFLATRPFPKVVATSISGDNLKDNLWAELAKWQGRSPFLKAAFDWSAERIVNKEHPETWFASARTWPKQADPTQQADTLAGLHADYLLFVIDEAGGVPDAVAATAEAGLSTGKETKFVLAGNPTLLSGPLYRACTADRKHWYVREITGDPDDPKRSPRINIEWARQQIATYGRENPWVLINVFGQFPPTQSNALLGVEDVNKAMALELRPEVYANEPRILGVDVARFGKNRTVLFPRQGRAAMKPKILRTQDVMQVSGTVAYYINEWKPHAVFIDVVGVGGGVYDRLNELGFKVHGVESGGKALRTDRFLNKRIEMWSNLAEWVKDGGGLPDISELRSELVAPTYKFNSRGQMVLESKEDLEKRGVESPDVADALAMTFAEPVAMPDMKEEFNRAVGLQMEHMRVEYDPFSPEHMT